MERTRCWQVATGAALPSPKNTGFGTIAFPAVSAGAYGFPMDRAAATAVTETAKFLARNKSVDTVMLVCFSDRAYQCYLDAVRDIVG